MQQVVTASEMRAIDKQAIEEYGIAGAILMENAGRGIVEAMRQRIPDLSEKKVIVFAGKGNNGGDGFVIARHLFNGGTDVRVILLCAQSVLIGDAKANAEAAAKIGVPIKEILSADLAIIDHTLRHCHVIVDAIFGTGLTKAAEGISSPGSTGPWTS